MNVLKFTKMVVVSVSALAFSAFADTSTSTTSIDNGVQDVKVNSNATSNTAATTDTARSDTALTTDVKTAFVKEKLFGSATVSAFSIGVETKNGVVHLTGSVDSQTQADNAVKLAKQVDGVKNVVSDIEIKVPAAK